MTKSWRCVRMSCSASDITIFNFHLWKASHPFHSPSRSTSVKCSVAIFGGWVAFSAVKRSLLPFFTPQRFCFGCQSIVLPGGCGASSVRRYWTSCISLYFKMYLSQFQNIFAQTAKWNHLLPFLAARRLWRCKKILDQLTSVRLLQADETARNIRLRGITRNITPLYDSYVMKEISGNMRLKEISYDMG